MKTIVLVSLCLCLLASAVNAEKQHKHQGKLLKSGHEEHKKQHSDVAVEPAQKEEEVADVKTPTAAVANEQTPVAKPAETGRKHRNNHHGKNKKRSKSEHNSDSHTGRTRKSQTKPKHKGQRSHNKHHSRKQGRGKQAQAQ